MSTALVYSHKFLNHKTGAGHPESPHRLEAIITKLKEGIMERFTVIEPDFRESSIAGLVHTPEYICRVRDASLNHEPFIDTLDNPISAASFDVALLAASGVSIATDTVFTKKAVNALVLTRPPGHHAEIDRAMGFCLFNNVAIGAKYAQKKYGADKIMIIDYDIHHGNGTQHIFENDPSVYYMSLHRYPFYPGTGAKSETGVGPGLGFTKNYPLSAETDDKIYIDIFQNDLSDVVLRFNPDFIILSSGFDAHQLDPLGGMGVSTEGFKILTEILVNLAEETCQGRMVSVLEGGYSLKGLADSVTVHAEALLKGKS